MRRAQLPAKALAWCAALAFAVNPCLPLLALAANVTQASLTVNPASLLAGQSATFTLVTPASYRSTVSTGVPIAFGDGTMGTIFMSFNDAGNSYRGTVTHTYAAAGTYQASVTLTAPAATAAILQRLTATVTVAAPSTPAPTAPPPPLPTPSKTSPPNAPAGYPIAGIALSWPNGSTQIALQASQSVPQAIARVRFAQSATVTAQWYVDGAPMQTVQISGRQDAIVSIAYNGPLPQNGRHSVSLAVISPPAAGLSPPTPAPPIAYAYRAQTAAIVAAVQLLHFEGFDVNVPANCAGHLTQNGSTFTFSGCGIAHLGLGSGAAFGVNFSNITITAPASDGSANVLAGSAASSGPLNLRPPSPGGSGGVSTMMKVRGTNGNAGAPAGQLAGNCAQTGTSQMFGSFGYGYIIYALSAQLNPKGTPSTATLCYYPYGVFTTSPPLGGFNLAYASSGQYGTGTGLQPVIVTIPSVTIDQNAEFDADVPGDQVGPYELGYTPFVVQPTHAQTLQLRFKPGDSAPRVRFDGTPFVGAGILQSAAQVSGTCTSCDWDPQGIDAQFSIAQGTTLYPGAPSGLQIVIGQNSLALQQSLFTGGTMNGTFAFGASAVSPLHVMRASSIASNDRVLSSAASFDSLQVRAASGQFATNGALQTIAANQLPSGSFSGTLTALGDLVAGASSITDAKVGGYDVTARNASLFVPGGQTSYADHAAFEAWVNGSVAGDQLWDCSNAPVLTQNAGGNGFVLAPLSQWAAQRASVLAGLMSGNANTGVEHLRASIPAAGSLLAALQGVLQTATSTMPQFPYPGLYISAGSVQTPFGVSSQFDASQPKGSGYGWTFVDDGGVSAMLNASGQERATLHQFPVTLQIFNLLILDGGVLRTNIWGDLLVPKPIDAHLAMCVQGSDLSGDLGSSVVQKGQLVNLSAWNATLTTQVEAPISDGAIALPDATLAAAGLPNIAFHVTGTLLADGHVQNDRLLPLQALGVMRLAQLDFTPQEFDFRVPSDDATNQPVHVVGNGGFSGWGSNISTFDLANAGGAFQPADPNFSFSIAHEPIGPVDITATINHTNGAWDGSGDVNATGFVDAKLHLHVDDSVEHGDLGVRIPNGGDGSSQSGSSTLANLGGEVTFARADGSLKELAFGADLTLDKFAGHVVALYDTPLNDAFIQQLGGAQNLQARGWDCSQAWCFAGSMAAQMDPQDKLSGEIDGLFATGGFSLYAAGQLQTQIDTIGASGQISYFDNPVAWDAGLSVQGIPVLFLNFDGEACVWNHTGGHVQNCLDTGVSEAGWGFYAKGELQRQIGPLSGELDVHVQYIDGGGGFGAGVHAHGSIDLKLVSADADVALGLESTSPLAFYGKGSITVCVICVSASGDIALTLDTNGLNVDSGGVSFGTCGACGWL